MPVVRCRVSRRSPRASPARRPRRAPRRLAELTNEKSGDEIVRDEREPEHYHEDRQQEEDDAEDRDERGLAALAALLDVVQVLGLGLDRVHRPTECLAVEAAGVLRRSSWNAHRTMHYVTPTAPVGAPASASACGRC